MGQRDLPDLRQRVLGGALMERRWNHRRDMMRAIALAGLLALPLPACVASSRVQPVSVTEADYVPLSKKGASWIYRTVKTGRIEGKLTIVNEGDVPVPVEFEN